MWNISDAARCALGLCAAAAILGGCSGAGQIPSPTAQTPISNTSTTAFRVASPSYATPQRVVPSSSGDEVLQGKLHTHCKYHAGLFTTCNFHTTQPGKATGPYPGTFTAEGSYEDSFLVGDSFGESFTLISGSSEITGSISCGGPFGGCPPNSYMSSIGNGAAEITKLTNRHLSETLDGL